MRTRYVYKLVNERDELLKRNGNKGERDEVRRREVRAFYRTCRIVNFKSKKEKEKKKEYKLS